MLTVVVLTLACGETKITISTNTNAAFFMRSFAIVRAAAIEVFAIVEQPVVTVRVVCKFTARRSLPSGFL